MNLVGAWNTVDAAIPALVAGGRGGSIVLTSSTQGIKASGTERAGLQAYAASKRGLVALMQGWAIQLAPHSIRVNTIHPSGVATDMILNEATMALAAADDPWLVAQQNALPIALLQPEDIAGAVAWLVSDAGKFITGTSWPLDAGFTLRQLAAGPAKCLQALLKRAVARPGRAPVTWWACSIRCYLAARNLVDNASRSLPNLRSDIAQWVRDTGPGAGVFGRRDQPARRFHLDRNRRCCR